MKTCPCISVLFNLVEQSEGGTGPRLFADDVFDPIVAGNDFQ